MKSPLRAEPLSIGTIKMVLLVVAVVFFAVFIWKRVYSSAIIELGGERFEVRIADNREKRAKGLGGSDPLEKNEGMLFVFESSGNYQFWMKGLTYPLDIIWVAGGKIVDIAPRVAPIAENENVESYRKYAPRLPADRVIEVAAGTVDRLGIKIGDSVRTVEN